MSYYDNVFLHDHDADKAARVDAAKDRAIDELSTDDVISGLAKLQPCQLDSFAQVLLDSADVEIEHWIRQIICAKAIAERVKQLCAD
mgnify:CR=1 FL=1